jgi:hypothetical protein
LTGRTLTGNLEPSYKPTVPRLRIGVLLRPASVLAGVLAAAVVPACTEPQAGVIVSHWCMQDPAFDTLDDMEDGDGTLCRGLGKWTFTPGAAISSTVPVGSDGALLRTEPISSASAGLFASDSNTTRAIRLTASGFVGADPDHWAFLRATLAVPGSISLATYSGIRFSARSAVTARIRINVATNVTRDNAASDDFGWTVTIDPTHQVPMTVLFSTMVQEGYGPLVDPDFANATALSFDVKLSSKFADDMRDTNPDTFDIWIDDVQLVK